VKLTKDEAVRLHRELWDWLSKNPGKEKYDWPGWKIYNMVMHQCFCCEYAKTLVEDSGDRCVYCPVVWPKETVDEHGNYEEVFCYGNDYSGLAYLWEDKTTPKEMLVTLAEQIRDLPIREDD